MFEGHCAKKSFCKILPFKKENLLFALTFSMKQTIGAGFKLETRQRKTSLHEVSSPPRKAL